MAKKGLERRVALFLVPLLLSWFLVSSFIVIYKGKRAIAHQVKGEVKRWTAAFTASRYESLADLVNTIGDKFDKSTWVSVYDKELNCVASTIGKRIGGGEDLRIAVQMGCQIEGFEKEGNKRIYHVITPLFSESGRATMDGLLEVGMSLNGINGYIFSAYRDILLILLLCIGVVGAIFYLSFRRYVTAPVQRLIDWIDLPDKDIELGGEGEISALAHSLSTTVKTTNRRIKDLERSNTDLKQEIEKKTTRLRKMSQDLEEAQDHLVRAGTLSALGEFAAGISHELNNPLGIILGFSQVLVDEVDSRHPHYENLRRIEIESSRCKKIVDDLLNFARPSDPYLEMVELNEIIDETLALISYHTPLNKIEIIKKYHAPLPQVLADSSQMEQVFMNVMINAMQAMSQGGELTIATSVCELTKAECGQLAASFMDYGDSLLVEKTVTGMSRRVLSKRDIYRPGDKAVKVGISDTGCGIAKEDLAKLFNPFFTTKKGGTGLGLSICWKLVNKQGGIIGAESIQGKGTRFTIKIPLGKK